MTTNPSLVSKEGREFKGLIKEICGIVDGPVSAEVVSVDSDGMVAEARDLVKIADNIVVKDPASGRRVKGGKDPGGRRYTHQCHTLLFSRAGSYGGKGGGCLHQSFRWKAGCYQPSGNGAG